MTAQIAAAAVALVALSCGSSLAAVALAAWLGPQLGAWILGSAAAIWLAAAVAAVLWYRRQARRARPALQETLEQLREDLALLAGSR